MMNKKIIILVLCLAVMAVVSGCWKKTEKKPVTSDNVIQNDNEQQEIEEVKQEKAEEMTTATEKSSHDENIENNIAKIAECHGQNRT